MSRSPRPFENEDEYWHLAGACLRARRRALKSKSAGGTDILSRWFRTDVLLQMRGRRATTGVSFPAPRIIRLAKRIALNDAEVEILETLILFACEPGTVAQPTPDAGYLAEFLELEAATFLDLFDEHRPLRRHGLIQVERDILGWPRSRDLKMDLPLVKALRGLPVSPEDHFALSEESVRAVLLEEPGLSFPIESASRVLPASNLPKEVESPAPPGSEPVIETTDQLESVVEPFRDDLEYLAEYGKWFSARTQWKKLLFENDDIPSPRSERTPDSACREAAARERVAGARLGRRLEETGRKGEFRPRGETLAESRGLDLFEKHVLLFLACAGTSKTLMKLVDRYGRNLEVGHILNILCDSLADQVRARKYFYRDSTLIREGLLTMAGSAFENDILECGLTIDRRMAEYLLGLENESSSLVEGSHLYTPRVDLDRVVLPVAQKKLIVDTVVGFPAFRNLCRDCGLDTILDYGKGQVLLFHGPSGTGKTMMANALATFLGRRVLLVNFPTVGVMTSDQALRFLFREAKIHNAIVFFDECDGIFEDREKNPGISLILTELERHDGLIIMATNRPLKLDEAMYRRITIAVEFQIPDAARREVIWRNHLPEGLRLERAPDLGSLARRFELSGGFIKNAVLAALSIATVRDPVNPVVRPEDLEEGARQQLRNRLWMTTFADRIVPLEGLSGLIVPPGVRESLNDLLAMERARRILVTEWGFEKEAERGFGTSALFFGPSGTGKSFAAEAIAWELGRPLKRVNSAQLVSKWVGEGAKNIEKLFEEARQHEAVLVFDEADSLFAGRTAVSSSSDRYANLDVAVLLSAMERFPGVVILTTNLPENIDPAFRRRLRFVVEFTPPDSSARLALWRRHIPSALPVEGALGLEALAEEFTLTGAQIRNAVIKAASRAALRDSETRRVTHNDLRVSANEEAQATPQPRAMGFSAGGELQPGELGLDSTEV